MSSVPEFVLADTDLPVGGLIIEASAGTGKTFSLTGIIIRLILEEGVELNEILVVTFTEAATAEIRDRVRKSIEEMMDALAGSAEPDAFQKKLIAGITDRTKVMSQLRAQLATFDPSNISTIHGFCQRMLVENAFESGSLFDCEVLQREEDLHREIAEDYWRREILAGAEGAQLQSLAAVFKSPDTLAGKLKARLRLEADDPRIKVRPAIRDFLEALRAHGPAFQKVMATKGQLNGRSYRQNIIADLNHLIETLLPRDPEDPNLPYDIYEISQKLNRLQHLGRGKILAARMAYDPTAQMQLFESADVLQEAMKGIEWSLFGPPWAAFADWAIPRLHDIKDARNLITFDDMLVRMRNAVLASAPLCSAIRARYRVALIDEFQDTDKVQLAIFGQLFKQPGHRLYCVGDPKQSIYQFRGADLATYLQARDDKFFKRFSLSCNHRSDHAVVEAVNRFFAFKDKPFGEDIPFLPVQVPAAKQRSRPPEAPAFVFRRLNPEAQDDSVARMAADEAAWLASRSGKFSSVAILVNTHSQAHAVASELRQRAIPCIRRVEQSVFATETCILLRLALQGLLQCNRVAILKTALATPLFGRTAGDIHLLDQDDAALDAEVSRMAAWRDRWREHGFMAAFQTILAEEGVRERLMRTAGGEETLSQMLHLAELLHAHERAHHCSPEVLVEAIAQLTGEESAGGSEATKVRRSTDADAVVISTIHSSKGLQYESVIIPFAWKLPKMENAAEGMRKLYVALTRARHRCTVLLSSTRNTEKTALAQILSQNGSLFDAALELATGSGGYIGCEDTPAPAVASLPAQTYESLQARSAPADISHPYWVASFSGLTAAAARHGAGMDSPRPEQADALDGAAPIQQAQALEDPLPASARTGVALHAIFEKIDFSRPDGLMERIREETSREGLGDDRIQAYLRERFPVWLSSSLLPGGSLPLNKIRLDQRLNELEFHFSLRDCSTESLARALAHEAIPGLEEAVRTAGLTTLAGFMKGYVDLVFRHDGRFNILDWKSNRLGSGPQAYSEDALAKSMLQHLYHVQYLIYTLALDTWLRQRLPDYDYDSHFGQVYYVFLRGFAGAEGHGVFRRRPKASTMQALRACLIRGEQS